jgi:hypothetical protein
MDPRFGPEQMDDDVAAVDQNPIALSGTLDADAFQTFAFEFFDEMFGHRLDVTGRGTGGDDHVVGDGRPAGKIDDDRIGRLVVVQGFFDEFENRLWGADGLARGSGDRRSPGLGVTCSSRASAVAGSTTPSANPWPAPHGPALALGAQPRGGGRVMPDGEERPSRRCERSQGTRPSGRDPGCG